jgi:hypothetical protein
MEIAQRLDCTGTGSSMKKVISLLAAKKSAEAAKYRALVLATFDDFKHTDKQGEKEKASELSRKNRNAF